MKLEVTIVMTGRANFGFDERIAVARRKRGERNWDWGLRMGILGIVGTDLVKDRRS